MKELCAISIEVLLNDRTAPKLIQKKRISVM